MSAPEQRNSQTVEIHRAARMIVQHQHEGSLHPIDFQRFRQALWGNPLDQRCDNIALLRMAAACIGKVHQDV